LAVLAALAGALCIGTADFMGGIAARRSHPLVTARSINVVALGTLALTAVAVRPDLNATAVAASLIGGVVAAAALVLIYASLAAGAMSLTAPLIASGSALVPTTVAVAAGDVPNERQAAGIALVLAGIVAITATPPGDADHVPLTRRALALTAAASLVGGAAFATMLAAVEGGDASDAVGVAALARLASTAVCIALVPLVLRVTPRPKPPVRPVLAAGAMEAAGSTCFLIGSTLGTAAVTAVIVSLYAVVTVMLAQAVLGERIAPHQGAGLVAAAAGIALLSAS
jgi:drug/metabolite transporter (DMT)-like permease